ncbi:MAG: hypothetical protein ACK5NN_12070 [Sphingomonadaceae bacterium]
MIDKSPKVMELAIICAFSIGLGACSALDYKVPENSSVIIEPQNVETLGETIAREQKGEDGCLVAGNLNKGGDCEKLRELFSPPKPSSDPKK